MTHLQERGRKAAVCEVCAAGGAGMHRRRAVTGSTGWRPGDGDGIGAAAERVAALGVAAGVPVATREAAAALGLGRRARGAAARTPGARSPLNSRRRNGYRSPGSGGHAPAAAFFPQNATVCSQAGRFRGGRRPGTAARSWAFCSYQPVDRIRVLPPPMALLFAGGAGRRRALHVMTFFYAFGGVQDQESRL